MSFDPMALHGAHLSYDSEEAVEADEATLRRIAEPSLLRRSAALKLAGRIVGMAVAERARIDDAALIEVMDQVLRRVSEVRHVALSMIGVERGTEDYPAAFNAVSGAALELVTQEWIWARMAGANVRQLPAGALGRLLDSVVRAWPERYDLPPTGSSVSTARRIAIFEATPKLYGLFNFFDFYQAQRDAAVTRLLRQVVERAEGLAVALGVEVEPTFAQRALIRQLYSVSTSMLCEVYKACAVEDVTKLRAMPELERSIAISQWERLGGMDYQHVIERHTAAMHRMLDTANLIMES